ncbi:MAG: hypothetical protein JSR33_07840, partial [Proteobacteria bacterium]|nr:hypothetical protein [Pseudomonadota bacterium]
MRNLKRGRSLTVGYYHNGMGIFEISKTPTTPDSEEKKPSQLTSFTLIRSRSTDLPNASKKSKAINGIGRVKSAENLKNDPHSEVVMVN